MYCSILTYWQGEVNRRTLANPAFRPHPPAVLGHDALDDGQPDAGALEFIHAMQALEYAEQFIRILHVEPDTVILYMINDLLFARFPSHLDMRIRTVLREFDRIGQQVENDL